MTEIKTSDKPFKVPNNIPLQYPPGVIQQIFQSPFPPSWELENYKKLDILDLVVEQIVKQADHRRNLEASSLTSQVTHIKNRDKEAFLGLIFAFILCLISLICATFAAIYNHPWLAGAILGVGGLTGLAAKFIHGRVAKIK